MLWLGPAGLGPVQSQTTQMLQLQIFIVPHSFVTLSRYPALRSPITFHTQILCIYVGSYVVLLSCLPLAVFCSKALTDAVRDLHGC